MTNNTVPGSGLLDALARLDQDIADTERRLAELRAMRESIQSFLEQYVTPTGHSPRVEQLAPLSAEVSTSGHVSTFTDTVVNVFKNHPDDVL
jgi:hypothetical protein